MSDKVAKHGRLAAIAVAALLPTILFVTTANNVILRNLRDLSYSPTLVAFFAAAFVTTWLASIPVAISASRNQAARLFIRASVAAALVILLADAATAISQRWVDILPLAIAVDTGTLAVAVLLACTPKFPTFVQVYGSIAMVLLGVGVFSHLTAVSSAQQQYQTVTAGATAPQSQHGNIYHIILDGFQSEAYALLAARERRWMFDGFTYYPRFKVSYFLTFYSVPHVLHGRAYDPSSGLLEWMDTAPSDGIWPSLQNAGYRLSLYPHANTYCAPAHAALCRTTQSTPVSGDEWFLERTIADLWFMSALPRSVRIMLAHGFAWDIAGTTPGAGVVRDMTPEDIFSISNFLFPKVSEKPIHFTHRYLLGAVANYRHALVDERARKDHGEYVFIHPVLPHDPTALDARCNYKGADAAPRFSEGGEAVVNAYLDQANCALLLVQELIDVLRDLGRYDDSLIIVHADHGMDPFSALSYLSLYGDMVEREWGKDDDDLGEWRKSNVVGMRSHALLLVKYPGAKGFETSDASALMMDIAPTMLRAAGAATEAFPGIALQGLTSEVERPIEFFAGTPVREFFEGADDRRMVFPANGHFSRFVLEGKQWKHRGDVPVH